MGVLICMADPLRLQQIAFPFLLLHLLGFLLGDLHQILYILCISLLQIYLWDISQSLGFLNALTTSSLYCLLRLIWNKVSPQRTGCNQTHVGNILQYQSRLLASLEYVVQDILLLIFHTSPR